MKIDTFDEVPEVIDEINYPERVIDVENTVVLHFKPDIGLTVKLYASATKKGPWLSHPAGLNVLGTAPLTRVSTIGVSRVCFVAISGSGQVEYHIGRDVL